MYFSFPRASVRYYRREVLMHFSSIVFTTIWVSHKFWGRKSSSYGVYLDKSEFRHGSVYYYNTIDTPVAEAARIGSGNDKYGLIALPVYWIPYDHQGDRICAFGGKDADSESNSVLIESD